MLTLSLLFIPLTLHGQSRVPGGAICNKTSCYLCLCVEVAVMNSQHNEADKPETGHTAAFALVLVPAQANSTTSTVMCSASDTTLLDSM